MLRRKLDHTSFAVNGKVFVAGGLRYRAVGYGGVDDFDKYDPILNSWTIDSLPAGRSLSESFSISGYGYILMGFDSTPWPETGPRPFIFTFLKYNPLTEALSGLSNTDHSRWGHSAMVLDDMGYVIGGQASEKLLESDPECGVESCQTRDVSKYNPVTQSWLSTTQYPMHPNGGTYTTFYAGAGEKSSGYQSSRHNPGVTSYAFHRISSKTDSWQSLDVDYEALNMAYYNVASLAN
jgi:hypothetical protein